MARFTASEPLLPVHGASRAQSTFLFLKIKSTATELVDTAHLQGDVRLKTSLLGHVWLGWRLGARRVSVLNAVSQDPA